MNLEIEQKSIWKYCC